MYEIEENPLFLQGKSRDTVLVGEEEICKVLSFVGGARDQLAPTIFQVANVNTGEIKFGHGEEVRGGQCLLTSKRLIKDWIDLLPTELQF